MGRLVIMCGLGLAVGLFATAWADDPIAPSQSEQVTPTVMMAEFCRNVRPGQRVYPHAAVRRGIQGSATLDCSLTTDNTLFACQIMEESPPDLGFGVAALEMACHHAPNADSLDAADSAMLYEPNSGGTRHLRWTVRFDIDSGRGSVAFARRPAPQDLSELRVEAVAATVGTCMNATGNSLDGDIVRECTRLIRSGLATPLGTAQAYSQRGGAHYRLGQIGPAVADYTEVVRLSPDDPRAYFNLALASHAQGDIVSAIANYDHAISIGLESAAAYSGRCRAHLLMMHIPQAEADCRRAVDLAPHDLMALGGLGLIQLMRQDFQGAWNSYDEALGLAPGDPYHLYGRGIAATHLGRNDEAQADKTAATERDDEIAGLYAAYGVADPSQ